MSRRTLAFGAIVILVAAAGWRILAARNARQVPNESLGMMSLKWIGMDTGEVKLTKVEFDWCPVDRTGRLVGLSATRDTGLTMLLHEPGTMQVVAHRVIPPGIPVPPPLSVLVALRLPRDRDSTVVAYQAQSGTVDLKGSPQIISGTFVLSMRRPPGLDTVTVTGSFSGIHVTTTQVGCQ